MCFVAEQEYLYLHISQYVKAAGVYVSTYDAMILLYAALPCISKEIALPTLRA